MSKNLFKYHSYFLAAFFVFSVIGCKRDYDSKFIGVIDESLVNIHQKISLRGSDIDELQIEKYLRSEISLIRNQTQKTATEKFLESLELIDKANFRLDSGYISVKSFEPYLVDLNKDTSIILFSIDFKSIVPNIYLTYNDTARQINLLDNGSLKFNNSKISWSNSSKAFYMGDKGYGLFSYRTMKGYDKNWLINTRLKCNE